MSNVEELKSQLAEAEANERLIAAKAAYRADPSAANRKKREKAIAEVVKIRNKVREGRVARVGEAG